MQAFHLMALFLLLLQIIHFPAGNVLFNLDRMKELNKLKGIVIPGEHHTNVSCIHSKLHWIVERRNQHNAELTSFTHTFPQSGYTSTCKCIHFIHSVITQSLFYSTDLRTDFARTSAVSLSKCLFFPSSLHPQFSGFFHLLEEVQPHSMLLKKLSQY